MRLTDLAALASFTLAAVPAFAQTAEDTNALFDAMGLPQIIEIMQEEGTTYGESIAEDMIAGGATRGWKQEVAQIYDVDVMMSAIRADFTQELQGDDVNAMLTFFNSDLGKRAVALEIAARTALLSDDVEQASEEAAALAMMEETPRFKLLSQFVDTNDLIESNVAGALNSNFAFFNGMIQGGGFEDGMSESEILTTVWSQEEEIRASTTEWVFSFLNLAYQPLSDADIEAYIAYSKSPAGKQMNAALFQAFDGTFEDISRKLGFASAQFMAVQEL